MTLLLVACGVSFAACVALTPLARRLGLALGAVNHPNHRKMHSEPVPRLGGAAIFAAFWAPLLLAYLVGYVSRDGGTVWSPRLMGFLGCSAALFLLGAIDDVRGLSARSKLPVEIALACAMYFCGFAVKVVTVPMLGTVDIGLLGLPVTVLWFVGIANAINLIDGIDGGAAGISAIAALTLASAATPTGSIKPILLAFCLMGASGGFLVHNFPPARVFMGDSGSLFLGFTLAAVATMTHHKSTAAVAMLVPIAALGVPIVDTASAVVRRIIHRRPVFSADSGHVHHRLLALGLSTRKSVLLLYLVAALCGLAAVNIAKLGGSGALVLIALLGLLLGTIVYRLGVLKPHVSACAGPRDEAGSKPAGGAGSPGA